jgi:hypothetical protein
VTVAAVNEVKALVATDVLEAAPVTVGVKLLLRAASVTIGVTLLLLASAGLGELMMVAAGGVALGVTGGNGAPEGDGVMSASTCAANRQLALVLVQVRLM